jgi:hypothetical protein
MTKLITAFAICNYIISAQGQQSVNPATGAI